MSVARRASRAASQAELADRAVRLNAAVAAGDPTGFAALFAPGLATDAAVLFDNARVVGAWRAEPGHEVLWLRSRAAAEQGWGSAAVVPALDADGRARVDAHPRVHHLDGRLNDFGDTAALIERLDAHAKPALIGTFTSFWG